MKSEPVRVVKRGADGTLVLESEPAVQFTLRKAPGSAEKPKHVMLAVVTAEDAATVPEWLTPHIGGESPTYLCQPRGSGDTRWTRKNPPNYVERSHVLLGHTVAAGQIRDILAAAAYLREEIKPVGVAGSGSRGIRAADAGSVNFIGSPVPVDARRSRPR